MQRQFTGPDINDFHELLQNLGPEKAYYIADLPTEPYDSLFSTFADLPEGVVTYNGEESIAEKTPIAPLSPPPSRPIADDQNKKRTYDDPSIKLDSISPQTSKTSPTFVSFIDQTEKLKKKMRKQEMVSKEGQILTDEQFNIIKSLLPYKLITHLVQDNRKFVNACLWALRNKDTFPTMSFHYLPESFGCGRGRIPHEKFLRWSDKGIFTTIFNLIKIDDDILKNYEALLGERKNKHHQCTPGKLSL